MQKITEEQIAAMAPNQAAAANGRKICQKGGFVRLERSQDDTFYMGECKGSGAKNYITSVDFIEPDVPLCRCSCPSRQFPCKHGLALLYEIASEKEFSICEIPEDIIKKREKRQNREKKAEAGLAEGDAADQAEKVSSPKKSKTSKAARIKKIQKQLEGLELAAQMVQNVLKSGLGTMGANGIKVYEELAKKLGDYYLPGPQHLVNQLVVEIRQFQNDSLDEHYEAAVMVLERLWALIKKSRDYLNHKLEHADAGLDDTELYELLGGAWKLEELEALNLCRKDVDLLQLSFFVDFDEAGKEYVDHGCYMDLGSGELFGTYNHRPVKALKHIKQDDSMFHITHVSSLAVYPGQCNQRIRWNGGTTREVTGDDLKRVISFAAPSILQEAKKAKNILKNPLAPDYYLSMIRYDRIGQCESGLAVMDTQGETILLGDLPGMEKSVYRIKLLPDTKVLEDQVLFGAFFYDPAQNRLKFWPLSIVTENGVLRLLY